MPRWFRVITVCPVKSAVLHRLTFIVADPDLWGHLRFGLDTHGRQRGGASHGSFFDVHKGARKVCMIAEGRQVLDTNLTSAVPGEPCRLSRDEATGGGGPSPSLG